MDPLELNCQTKFDQSLIILVTQLIISIIDAIWLTLNQNEFTLTNDNFQ